MREIKWIKRLTYLTILLFAVAALLFSIVVFIKPDGPESRQKSLGIIYLFCLFGGALFIKLDFQAALVLEKNASKALGSHNKFHCALCKKAGIFRPNVIGPRQPHQDFQFRIASFPQNFWAFKGSSLNLSRAFSHSSNSGGHLILNGYLRLKLR